MRRLRVLHQLTELYGSLILPADLVDVVEVVDVAGTSDALARAEGDVLLTTRPRADSVPAGVRWIHLIGTGIDGVDLGRLGAGGRILTNSRGAAAIPISEWVLAMMLAFVKDLPESWISSPPPRWVPDFGLRSLHGEHLALFGFGSIGTAVAERVRPFGMHVRALRRSDRAVGPGIELVSSLDVLVEGADHVVLAAPLTAETRSVIGDDAFSDMKQGVHLVNVARGGLIEQDALRRALDTGVVARASLDTVTPEPLPEGHWLYSHPRVKLSPHVSYNWPRSTETLLSSFFENLRRFLRGGDLVNVLDADLGY